MPVWLGAAVFFLAAVGAAVMTKKAKKDPSRLNMLAAAVLWLCALAGMALCVLALILIGGID